MPKHKNITVSSLIEKAWTKDDKAKYHQLKKDIKAFNRQHFSSAKNTFHTMLNIFATIGPMLLSIIIYLLMVIFIDRFGKQLVTNFEEKDLLTVSIAIISFVTAIYSAIVVGLIIGTNKGNDYFGKTENKMFWNICIIVFFTNLTWLINASLMMALSVLSFLTKDYAGLFSSSIFVLIHSSILLFSYLSFKNKSGKEKCLLYLKSLGLMKQKVRGLAIKENRLYRKHLNDKTDFDDLLNKLAKLNYRTLGSLSFLVSKAKEKALKDLNVKEEQNILEDFFKDYSSIVSSTSQATFFVALCKVYIDSFTDSKIPKQNIKEPLLTKESIIESIKAATLNFEKAIADFPIDFENLPKLVFFKRNQIRLIDDFYAINSYYKIAIIIHSFMLDSINKIIDKAPKTEQVILKKNNPYNEINNRKKAFSDKYDHSEQLNNYIDQKTKLLENLAKKIQELPCKPSDSGH